MKSYSNYKIKRKATVINENSAKRLENAKRILVIMRDYCH